MKQLVFRGQLVKTSNSEEDNLLGLVSEEHKVEILAEKLQLDLAGGRKVTVRYFTSEKPMDKNALDLSLAKVASGLAEADYGMHYSELTGYLWTDEKFKVGGHDLLAELRSFMGKYLHLEIDVHGKR